MKFWKKGAHFSMATFLMTIILGCTEKVASSGACKRTCGGRPIGGGGSLRGKALDGDLTIKCTTPGASLGSFTRSFLIFDEAPAAAAGSTATAGDVPSRIPQAGIAFTPNPPFGATVTTPASDWCTDSCGVASFSFTATCAVQTYAVGVFVPGMLFDGGAEVPSAKWVISND